MKQFLITAVFLLLMSAAQAFAQGGEWIRYQDQSGNWMECWLASPGAVNCINVHPVNAPVANPYPNPQYQPREQSQIRQSQSYTRVEVGIDFDNSRYGNRYPTGYGYGRGYTNYPSNYSYGNSYGYSGYNNFPLGYWGPGCGYYNGPCDYTGYSNSRYNNGYGRGYGTGYGYGNRGYRNNGGYGRGSGLILPNIHISVTRQQQTNRVSNRIW